MQVRALPGLLKEAASEWVGDNAPRLSAALAYYAIFSLAPLVIITISIAGLVFGEEAARGQISEQIKGLAGEQAGNAIQSVVKSTDHKGASIFAASAGLIVLLFGASGVFGELKNALNTIWGVVTKPGKPVMSLIRSRFLSFGMVLAIGFLLLISLAISAALSAIGTYMRNLLVLAPIVWQGVEFLISFAVVTVLFAMIFKFLPDVKIRWRDVWIGAIGTALLFAIGKTLIGLYLGASSVGSSYGAAGSAIIILLWIYYSSCILFYGAEFTKVYAKRLGCGITPTEDAMPLRDAMKEKQEKRK
ncbi:MAG: YihY/virulence factor BrkB family protein [Verrucomicrobiota bacterium]